MNHFARSSIDRPVTDHLADVNLESSPRYRRRVFQSWELERPIVQVGERWFPLASVDGIPIERIVNFTKQEYGDLAQKRFAEDLVEVLSKMGHDVEWEVTLGLVTQDGNVEELKVFMTEENRRLAREYACD